MPAYIPLAKERHMTKLNINGSINREVYPFHKDEREEEREKLLAEDDLIYPNHNITFM